MAALPSWIVIGLAPLVVLLFAYVLLSLPALSYIARVLVLVALTVVVGVCSWWFAALRPFITPFYAAPTRISDPQSPAAAESPRDEFGSVDYSALAAFETVSAFWHPKSALADATTAPPAMSAALMFLASTKFISDLTPAQFDMIFGRVEFVSLPAESTLYQIGADSLSGLYIVVDGAVGLYDSAGQLGCTYVRGELIGDECLTGATRDTTVRALSAVDLLRVSSAHIDELPHVAAAHRHVLHHHNTRQTVALCNVRTRPRTRRRSARGSADALFVRTSPTLLLRRRRRVNGVERVRTSMRSPRRRRLMF